MIPDNALLVIEAPGKRPALFSLLQSVRAPKTTKVAATRGRLYDLPTDHLGVDLDALTISERRLINPPLTEQLRKDILASSVVYLMTDDDEEGEWIASQVCELAPTHHFLRTPLPALSLNDFARALANPRELNESVIRSAVARRISDRIIGYGLSQRDYKAPVPGAVGRVLSPILAELQGGSDRGSASRQVIGPDRHTYEITVPITGSQDNDQALRSLLADLPAPDLEVVSDEECDAPLPLTGPEALVGASDATGLDPSVIAGHLQSQYERGILSYPRSDAYYLTEERVAELAQTASAFGMRGFDPSLLLERAARWAPGPQSTGAHHAVVPIGKCDPERSRRSATDEGLVRHFIAHRSILAGLNCSWRRRTATFRDTPSSRDWRHALADHMDKISITSLSYCLPHRAPRPVLQNTDPLALGECSIALRRYSPERLVLEQLVRASLGRPSTLPIHAKQIATQYLTPTGELNGRGIHALQRVRDVCPLLLDRDVQRRLSLELFGASTRTSAERALRVMQALQIDVRHVPQAEPLDAPGSPPIGPPNAPG